MHPRWPICHDGRVRGFALRQRRPTGGETRRGDGLCIQYLPAPSSQPATSFSDRITNACACSPPLSSPRRMASAGSASATEQVNCDHNNSLARLRSGFLRRARRRATPRRPAAARWNRLELAVVSAYVRRPVTPRSGQPAPNFTGLLRPDSDLGLTTNCVPTGTERRTLSSKARLEKRSSEDAHAAAQAQEKLCC